MTRTEISTIYKNHACMDEQELTVCGWVRSSRSGKSIVFIDLNDGSCLKNLQIIAQPEQASLNVGTAITVRGQLVLTPDGRQPFELNATDIEVTGESPADYVLQKKRHSPEFLRAIPHLRPRTNLISAVLRVRAAAAAGIHRFFDDEGFFYVHTPIITTSDCEGAGEMFTVTTLDMQNPPRDEQGGTNFDADFFGRRAALTVSGQLEGEALAMALGKIYTFGPTFRAEHSNTPRHAAEFWMIEPEIAFADLRDDMDLAEGMVKSVIGYVMGKCPQDLEFLNSFVDNTLIRRLNAVKASAFDRLTYTEAIELLQNSGVAFEYPVSWGCDLQTEHERWLAETHCGKPVFITDYPQEIKSFYMRQNGDGTVAAMDLLVPGVGELIGGSQREERLELLEHRMTKLSLSPEDYGWYCDLRRFGGTPHAGFGLGFERLIMYLTGVQNIRDVIPFPRTFRSAGM